MRTVCIFSVLLGSLVPISDAISAVITPMYEAFVLKGDSVILNCTLLDLNSSQNTAEDILWYKDNLQLSAELSHAISSNTSQLIVTNSTFDDSGNYGCGFPEDSYYDRELIVVTVGLPPSPVQNLTCRSPNVLKVYCTWTDGAVDTNIRNTHTAKYRREREEELRDVNQDSQYSCNFDVEGAVYVRVTSTNKFGFAEKELYFNSEAEVIPNSPENVRAEPYSPNGNTTLRVTWGQPSEWLNHFTLDYRVRYWSESSSEPSEKKIDNNGMVVNLEGLDPFTAYHIEVAAKSIVTSDLWSEPGITSAKTEEGIPFGSVSSLSLRSDTDSIQKGLRHVQLEWEPPLNYQWGSESIYYIVNMIPVDISPGHSLKNYTETVNIPSVLILDVSKYQTYTVQITPGNLIGHGQQTTIQNAVPDRTSTPGRPTELNVTLMESDTLHITWKAPQNPNGIIYDYEVVVSGKGWLSSNQTNAIDEDVLKTHTNSLVMDVAVNCTQFTKDGLSIGVQVAARTMNYTRYIFQGEYAEFIQMGVCKEKNQPNFVFIGIFIPCSVIVSCIVALVLWNFFKDTCVEPPEPYIPNKLKRGDHITIGNIPGSNLPPEKEWFDDLKPKKEVSNISVDIGKRPSNPYQNPRIQPKATLERINSNDSGMPESPVSHCEDGIQFYNQGFVDEDMEEHRGRIQSISRNVSLGESDGVSSLWRQSGVSNGSADSGTDVMKNEEAEDVGPMSTSSSTDQPTSPDPYFKVSALPVSFQSSELSSPYVKPPAGQAERVQEDASEDVDELENDCPFDDVDSNSGYLQQYQLGSPTSLTSNVPPYMTMTPISPPPASSCVPNGYVSHESLPSPHKEITTDRHDKNGFVAEEYSTMVDSQGVSEGYLKHNVIPTSKQLSETPVAYISHTTLPSTNGNYQDDYPDFNHSAPSDPGPRPTPTLGPKQDSGNYVRHKDISLASLLESPYIPNTMKNSSSSEMPYSKLALNDYTHC